MKDIIGLMNIIGKKYAFFKNPVFQIVVIIILTGVTFAFFHVGKLFLSFLVAAFIFRAIQVFFIIGDAKLNFLPFITLLPAFAVGSHIGNNMGAFGIAETVQLLNTNFVSVGWIVYALLIVLFISAFNQVGVGIKKVVD